MPSPLAGLNEDCLSPAALSVALKRPVRKVTVQPNPTDLVADGAVGTDRFRLRLEFESSFEETPLDVFVKLPSLKSWLAAFLRFCGLYQTELWFYQQQQAGVLKIPRELMTDVIYSGSKGTRFMIMLEDVSQPSEKIAREPLMNLLMTCRLERLKAVLSALARLHSIHWGSPHVVWSERLRSPFLHVLAYASLLAFKHKFPNTLPPKVEQAYRNFIDNYHVVRRFWNRPPLTLIHGDAHSGNVFFKADGTCGFFDWQVVSAEHPMRDVTYFLLYAGDEETLAEHEEELIHFYLSRLEKCVREQHGDQPVTPVPTFQEAWFQYRIHAFYPLLAAILPAGLGDFVPDRQAVRGFTARVVTHFQRLQAASALVEVLEMA